MEKTEFVPRKVYIEKQSLTLPITKRVLNNIGQVPSEIIDDPQDFLERRKISRDSVEHGKKDLFITRKKGGFIKPCPCTPHYIGCNYFVINLDLNCPLDCTYCILQNYLPDTIITITANLDELWKQLDVFLHQNQVRSQRIGTGELGDSLVLDHITENSKDLISYFRNKPNVLFELKTKTVNIKNIVDAEPAQNIVISWSLNSSRIAESEEEGAPSVEERIDAARRILDCGFRVGFHFDPLIRYPGCENDYKDTIENLLGSIDPARIAWMSLGSLRFPPSLHSIIKERFPKTKIIYDEMIKGKDGKLRYFRPLRLEMYKNIVRFIKENGGQKIPLYFCMEGESVWREVLGWVPKRNEELEDYLSSHFWRTNV
jgi:spore photoproduct lyase